MNTYVTKAKDINRRWWLIDAEGLVLGRLASEVAAILRGKHKPYYSPSLDTGDFVIVINAAKVVLTKDKLQRKLAYRHSGYPGGLRQVPYTKLMAEKPERVVELAVKGMLPHGRLGRAMLRKLHVYPGGEHPHQAQKPEPLALSFHAAPEVSPLISPQEVRRG